MRNISRRAPKGVSVKPSSLAGLHRAEKLRNKEPMQGLRPSTMRHNDEGQSILLIDVRPTVTPKGHQTED